MSRATISFLSTRGRAMNIDLKLIQDYLALNLSDVTFEYYEKHRYESSCRQQTVRRSPSLLL